MAWNPPEDAFGLNAGPDEPGGSGAATSDSGEILTFRGTLVLPSVVCVVEPDPTHRLLFSRMLAAAGFDVRVFVSRAEFLSDVGPREAGCVVFAADGRTRTADREIRSGDDVTASAMLARLAACQSPLAPVAVAAALPMEPALQLLRQGALDVLEKPVRRDELLTAVREALVVSAGRRDRRTATLRMAGLSERQFRLLGLLASRWPRWIVALRAGLWPGDLDRMSLEICRLMGVATPADAARLYHEVIDDSHRRHPRAGGR